MYVCMYIYIYISILISLSLYIHVCMCVCVYIYIYIYIYTRKSCLFLFMPGQLATFQVRSLTDVRFFYLPPPTKHARRPLFYRTRATLVNSLRRVLLLLLLIIIAMIIIVTLLLLLLHYYEPLGFSFCEETQSFIFIAHV